MFDIVKSAMPSLIIMLLASSVTAVGSKLATGDWLKCFRVVPPGLWVIFVGGCVLWGLISAIRSTNRNRRDNTTAYFIPFTRDRVFDLFHIKHGGVVWKVITRRVAWDEGRVLSWLPYDPRDVTVEELPLCDGCSTELSEGEDWLGYVVWRCPNEECGWMKKTTKTFSEAALDAAKVARNEFRKRLLKDAEERGVDITSGEI